MELGELPPIDLVVLSHSHADHFDRVAQKDLDKSLPIVTTPEAVEELKERGFTNAHALNTWSSLLVRKGDVSLRITSTPGRHGPLLSDLVLPEVMGSMLEFQSPMKKTLYRMYVSGDTLVMDDMKEIARRYPNIDLALLDLGGARVLGVMVTMDAKQGVQMMQTVNSKRVIPLAYNDYNITEPPLLDFKQAVNVAGLQDRVRYLNYGGTYIFKSLPEHANSRDSASNVH